MHVMLALIVSLSLPTFTRSRVCTLCPAVPQLFFRFYLYLSQFILLYRTVFFFSSSFSSSLVSIVYKLQSLPSPVHFFYISTILVTHTDTLSTLLHVALFDTSFNSFLYLSLSLPYPLLYCVWHTGGWSGLCAWCVCVCVCV